MYMYLGTWDQVIVSTWCQLARYRRIYVEHYKGYGDDLCGSTTSQLSRWTKGCMTVWSGTEVVLSDVHNIRYILCPKYYHRALFL